MDGWIYQINDPCYTCVYPFSSVGAPFFEDLFLFTVRIKPVRTFLAIVFRVWVLDKPKLNKV